MDDNRISEDSNVGRHYCCDRVFGRARGEVVL